MRSTLFSASSAFPGYDPAGFVARFLFGALVFAVALALGCERETVYVSVDAPPPAASSCSSERSAELCFVDPGIDAEAPRAFLERESTETPPPSWVYPLEASVHPPNLQLLSLHFVRGSLDHDVFEVVVRSGDDLRVLYVPCFGAGGLGCTYQLPESFWREVASHFAGREVTLELREAGAQGPSLAAKRKISFAARNVEGGLYFWSADLRGLYRLVFGSRQAVPFVTPRSEENPDACSGCHSISRDGGTVAFTRGQAEEASNIYENAAFNGSLTVAPVLEPDEPLIAPEPGAPSDSAMMALSSDGSRVVSAFDYVLRLRDTEDGRQLDELGRVGEKSAFFPEWSPRDDALVATLSSQPDSEIAVRSGSIAIIEMANDAFGEIVEIVPEEPETAHYYPTWSPDGEWIAFVSGPGGPETAQKSYYQKESRLRLVRRTGGTVYELARATGRGDQTTTWPKFAPFQQCASDGDCSADERIFFLTFSTRRNYGLRLTSSDEASSVSQLWMSAIDLRLVDDSEASDPSLPPLWIPYQSIETPNHLGFWTEELRCGERLPCGPGEACTSGICQIVVR